MATRTDPQFKPPGDGSKPAATEDEQRPRFEDRVKFEELGKYEEITLPPHARLKWMAAELPSASPELLQDTVPPNGGVKAPPKAGPETKSDSAALTASEPAPPVTREPEHASKPAAQLLDPLAEQETMLIPRVRRKRRLRDVVVLAVGAAAMLTVVGVILWWHGSSNGDTPARDAVPPVGASPPQATEVATPKPTLPTSAVTATTAPAASSEMPPRSAATAPDPKHDGRSAPKTKPSPATQGKPPAPPNDFDVSKSWED